MSELHRVVRRVWHRRHLHAVTVNLSTVCLFPFLCNVYVFSYLIEKSKKKKCFQGNKGKKREEMLKMDAKLMNASFASLRH